MKKGKILACNEPSWLETFKERFVTGKFDEAYGKQMEKAKKWGGSLPMTNHGAGQFHASLVDNSVYWKLLSMG